MLLNENNRRALKGFLTSSLLSSKKMFIVIGAILVAQPVLGYILMVIFHLNGVTDSSSGSSSSVLNSGLDIALVMLIVVAIISASSKGLAIEFTFPLSRNIYGLGNFIMTILSANALLLITSVAAVVEILLGNLVASIFKDFVLINKITLENFIVGYWVSMSYVVFAASLVYCLFMYIFKYTLKAVVPICLLLVLMLSLAPGRNVLVRMFTFLVWEPSIWVLSIKLWVLTIALHLIGFIPLKSKEVTA